MKKFVAKAAFLFTISLFIFSLTTRSVFAATKVSPSNMNGWAFQVQSPNGSGTFVEGPATAPLGNGSARLFTGTAGTTFAAIHNSNFNNVDISSISNLDVSTFSVGTSVGDKYPRVVIDVNTDYGTDELIFDPENQSQAVQQSVWQSWSAENGVWSSTLFPGFAGGTLSQYSVYVQGISSISKIVNRGDGTGGLRIQVGSGQGGDVFDGNVDNFTIGISGSDTTYDFDPDVVAPTNNLSGNIYSDNNFTTVGAPAPTFNNNFFQQNWGLGSPASGVPVDNFSARWEGTFNFENVRYRFATTSDNKAKVYLDGNLVLDQTSRGTGQGLVTVAAGVHTVRMEYIHGTGVSFFWANFWKADVCYDMNGDNRINSTDQLVIAKHFNAIPTVVTPWDLNYDTKVNSLDMLMLAQKFNKTCPFI